MTAASSTSAPRQARNTSTHRVAASDTKAPNDLVDALQSLSIDGYCIIRNFLSPDAVDAVVADYRERGASDNANYQIGLASTGAVGIVKEKIAALAAEAKAQTGICTAFEGLHQGYYFDTQVLTFNSWHQDAESQYMLGTHADYLNFYIPIVKEERERTNVQVVPASRIREHAPDAWHLIENGGGTICHVAGDGKSTVVFDEAGERVVLAFDINDLAETPHLGAGDLLLMRGDTFHRTQDADTNRVALSLRLANPDLPIRLKDLTRGSSKKVNMMAGNWAEFGPVFDLLEKSSDGEAPWKEVRLAIEEGASNHSPKLNRSEARLHILKEKLRQGAVIDTVKREVSYRLTRRRLGI